MNKLIFVAYTLLISSCGHFINQLEKNDEVKIHPPKEKKGLYCKSKPKEVYFSRSSTAHNLFNETIEKLSRFKKVSRNEKVLLFAIFQMYTRPDASSFNSSASIYLNTSKKGQGQYHHYGKNSNSAYIHALNDLRKKLRIKKSLVFYLIQLEKFLPKKMELGIEMRKFLLKSTSTIKSSPYLEKSFTRSGEIIIAGESFRWKSLQAIARKYLRKKTLPSKKLKMIKNSLNCNFVLAKYKLNDYRPGPQQEEFFNSFGYKSKDLELLIVTSSIPRTPILEEKISFLPTAPGREVAFCQKGHLKMFAFSSRDPFQQLYHISNYNIPLNTDAAGISEFIKLPRHQVLKSPSRIIFESEKASLEHQQIITNLGLPIYNIEKLGEVIISSKDNINLDQRGEGYIQCQ